MTGIYRVYTLLFSSFNLGLFVTPLPLISVEDGLDAFRHFLVSRCEDAYSLTIVKHEHFLEVSHLYDEFLFESEFFLHL